MDQILEEFCKTVLDWGHRHISRHDMERVARHLRDTAIPQLQAYEQLQAETKKKDATGRRQAVTA